MGGVGEIEAIGLWIFIKIINNNKQINDNNNNNGNDNKYKRKRKRKRKKSNDCWILRVSRREKLEALRSYEINK